MSKFISLRQNYISNLNETSNRIKVLNTKFEEKVKGTIAENWVKFWKNLFIDYKDVVVDLRNNICENPRKAVRILSGIGVTVYCAKHNPDQSNYRQDFLQSSNYLLLVPISSQNPKSAIHLQNIERCYNKQSVRRLNLGIASIIWTDDYSDSCHSYKNDCPYLKLQYIKFKERIIDIGFLRRWWILQHKMINYDINY